ncbi:MAG: hypothetical protein Q7S37_02070 [bacterium]|nr:hypothetical protein [bacterium]
MSEQESTEPPEVITEESGTTVEPPAITEPSSQEETVKPRLWHKVAKKMGKAVDFAKNCYVVTASYVVGSKSPELVQPVADGSAPTDIITHPGFGIFTVLVALTTMFGSIFLNRLGAGAILPDNEPLKLQLFGWDFRVDPPLCMALVMSLVATMCGKLALGKRQLESILTTLTHDNSADDDRRRTNSGYFGWILLIMVVLVISSMAAYRVWVLNGYQLYWNVPGVFLLTFVVETALALSMAIGLHLFMFPCGDRAFHWSERNWKGLRTAIRFIFGLIAFVALLPVIVFCEVVFASAVFLTWFYEIAIEKLSSLLRWIITLPSLIYTGCVRFNCWWSGRYARRTKTITDRTALLGVISIETLARIARAADEKLARQVADDRLRKGRRTLLHRIFRIQERGS